MSAPSKADFSPNFVWGVSTSSYQVEGAVHEDGRGPSIWDTRCLMKDRVANGDTGNVACDHYHRYGEDIALMKTLGVSAYRFSVAWPRVLPSGKGVVNEKGLAFYDRLIDGLLEAGIEPWLCLYHWDLPQALDDLGGWISRDSAGWFADYSALVGRRFGDRVKRWATFNEPGVFTMFGYAIDWGAPGITDRSSHLRAIHHVNLAHGDAVAVLRATVPGASIGAVHNFQSVVPESDQPENRAAAALLDEHWNRAFPDPQLRGFYPPQLAKEIAPYTQAGDMARICQPIDWFGLNHYGPIFAKADPSMTWGYAWGSAPPEMPSTDIGWSIHPAAFRDTLLTLSHDYHLPIYITENGCGGKDTPGPDGAVDDAGRVAYLAAYVAAMREAMEKGADVRGYFVWSLLDNFEWGAGYTNRFGIVYVDFATQRRIPKASAAWFGKLAKSGRIPE